MRTVDIVLFDKTGTLTEGAHAVTSVVPAAEATEGEVLALASAAEANSEHPVAQAIVAAAAENEDASAMALRGSDFRTAAGRGDQLCWPWHGQACPVSPTRPTFVSFGRIATGRMVVLWYGDARPCPTFCYFAASLLHDQVRFSSPHNILIVLPPAHYSTVS